MKMTKLTFQIICKLGIIFIIAISVFNAFDSAGQRMVTTVAIIASYVVGHIEGKSIGFREGRLFENANQKRNG